MKSVLVLALGLRFFMSGGAVADDDRTWASASPTIALGVAAGVDVSPHIGLRVATDVPKTITTQSVNSSSTFRSTARHRSISWSALVDLHGQLSQRVRLGVVTGMTAAIRPSEYDTSVDELGPGGAVVRHSETRLASTFTWWGLTAGAELPVALSDRVSVVPDARVIAFPLAEYGRTTIFRSGVSLRWRF